MRLWPAPDYTRVTIESDGQLSSKQIVVPTPPRLAVDIEGIELNPALRELVAKVQADDPYIAGIRVGQFAPGVVRLVIDLKQQALPQARSIRQQVPVSASTHLKPTTQQVEPHTLSSPLCVVLLCFEGVRKKVSAREGQHKNKNKKKQTHVSQVHAE